MFCEYHLSHTQGEPKPPDNRIKRNPARSQHNLQPSGQPWNDVWHAANPDSSAPVVPCSRHVRGSPLLAVLIATLLALLSPLTVQAADGQAPTPRTLQQTTTPQIILTEGAGIEDWTHGGDFFYWSDYCRPGPSNAPAIAKRRAVHGTLVLTLGATSDEDRCDTFIRPGADEGGYYYYNRFAETIEAFFNNEFYSGVTVLADAGFLREVDLSSFTADDDYIYWIQQIRGGEFFPPDELHLRRLAKTGGSIETLQSYEASMNNPLLAVNDDWFVWLDENGLRGIPKAACPGACITVAELHDVPLTEGQIVLTPQSDIVWTSNAPHVDARIFHTTCATGVFCDTVELYSAPQFVDIPSLVADGENIYWTETDGFAVQRLMRMPTGGGSPVILVEDDLDTAHLELDSEWVYFKSANKLHLLRLPLDAAALTRELSFRGWEITQAIQNLENDVPLIAGNETYVRVYPQIDSGAGSGGVEVLLHGERDGSPLPGSPLRPLNGLIDVRPGVTIDIQRGELDPHDTSWLFQLPPTWTKTEDVPIPLEDAELTLRVEIDPRSLTGDTTPQNNQFEDTFTFFARAPTCIRTRPVWTANPYQSSWDASVAGVMAIGESMHPTAAFIPFPSDKRLEKVKMCRKGFVYGPFCKGPYDLNRNDETLLLKLWRKDFIGGVPDICREHGARTLLAGIVAADADWGPNGLALRRPASTAGQATVQGNVSLNKVPRVNTYAWPLNRHVHLATTFIHEIGHNYGHRHIDCEDPPDIDDEYPYDPCTLDSRPPTEPTTYFGFDGLAREPAPPATNTDYMSYRGPRWISDYHWRKVFDRTRLPEPLLPNTEPRPPIPTATAQTPDAYVLLSGLITPTVPTGALEATWNYPTAAAGDSLLLQWSYYVPEIWTDEPYHIRLLDEAGAILDDRAVDAHPLIDVEHGHHGEAAHVGHAQISSGMPFVLAIPAPATPVATVQLLAGETVLDSYSPASTPPTVDIHMPQGGETITDTLVLEWQAEDPDGAPWLEYTVQYSPDNGENWYAVETDLFGPGENQTERLELDLRGQPGSDGATARVRVLATDGYHTGMATSAPFSVAPRAPEVLITTPEAEQWFAPPHAISLRGTAFDPEDGIVPASGYAWDLDGAAHSGPQTNVVGLAPGAYTATLTVTNSRGQSGNDTAGFYIAPLDVPQASATEAGDMILNGRCDDAGYAQLTLPLLPYADGEVAYAAIVRTQDHLWVCLQGLKHDDVLEGNEDSYAGFQLDLDHSRAGRVQAQDRGFFVRISGASLTFAGDGSFFTPVEPAGLATRVVVEGELWRAELRLDLAAIGGLDRQVGLAVGHYFGVGDEQRSAWPHAATLHSPQTWATTNLHANPVPHLTGLAPISATLSSTAIVTLTGSNFRADSVALWNGAAVATTFVDDTTLQITLEGEQTDSAGMHTVQVAPQTAPDLATPPHQFLIYHAPPEISAVSPITTVMESSGLTLTVDGSGFVPGATVFWEGEPRATTFVNDTRLAVEITATDVEAARTIAVVAHNPQPAFAASDTIPFTVVEPEDGDPDNGDPDNGDPDNGDPDNGDPDNGDDDSEFRLFVPGLEKE